MTPFEDGLTHSHPPSTIRLNKHDLKWFKLVKGEMERLNPFTDHRISRTEVVRFALEVAGREIERRKVDGGEGA